MPSRLDNISNTRKIDKVYLCGGEAPRAAYAAKRSQFETAAAKSPIGLIARSSPVCGATR
jgi:hypothetical protein